METLTTEKVCFYNVQKIYTSNIKAFIISLLICFMLSFALLSKMLSALDPAVGVLDLGILTVGLFGLAVGLAAILCSLWLQELLWQPFKTFRKDFLSHFNQLTSWQQCILYFSVFFLMLYAVIVAVGVVM
ncbi:hypothetical protein [Sphingobacterium yanglingense]|uniref:Uncharacterized protein n=1 Tax=Sphingobacterium yanglingense TaxID=1437280 RepID=A0A4R6WIR9_9SPHI|nr:hypothetical protein [Sphingobacterium yanglingense]TDQ80133.1 hypothetical protein CLV99_1588 [Sphingobacterium yanglingense]